MSTVTIVVDPRVYRLSAVKKAAYRLGDRCSALIALLPEGGIQVRLSAKSEGAPAEAIEPAFLSELMDQELREVIASETERVRNLLLAQAFSGLSLTDAEADTADYRNDPMEIGRSQAAKS
jgi:His-Xaa-Ser system protein HxsD